MSRIRRGLTLAAMPGLASADPALSHNASSDSTVTDANGAAGCDPRSTLLIPVT